MKKKTYWAPGISRKTGMVHGATEIIMEEGLRMNPMKKPGCLITEVKTHEAFFTKKLPRPTLKDVEELTASMIKSACENLIYLPLGKLRRRADREGRKSVSDSMVKVVNSLNQHRINVPEISRQAREEASKAKRIAALKALGRQSYVHKSKGGHAIHQVLDLINHKKTTAAMNLRRKNFGPVKGKLARLRRNADAILKRKAEIGDRDVAGVARRIKAAHASALATQAAIHKMEADW